MMISVTPALRFAFHICTVYVDVSRKYQILRHWLIIWRFHNRSKPVPETKHKGQLVSITETSVLFGQYEDFNALDNKNFDTIQQKI